jgi:hypothetical protein
MASREQEAENRTFSFTVFFFQAEKDSYAPQIVFPKSRNPTPGLFDYENIPIPKRCVCVWVFVLVYDHVCESMCVRVCARTWRTVMF